MAKYTTQVAGDILENAPVSPTNFLQVAAGIMCKCNGVNSNPANTLVDYTATVPLAGSPNLSYYEAIVVEEPDGSEKTIRFSKPFLFSPANLGTGGVLAEFVTELQSIFNRYLVDAGNVAAVDDSGLNVVVTVTARLPFVPLAIIADGNAVPFV
jgi:hypothetical protein